MITVPIYTILLCPVYIVLYCTLSPSQVDNILMATSYPLVKQAWRWCTYSYAHGSTVHIAVNVVTFIFYGGYMEYMNGTLRFAPMHTFAILSGAFGLAWWARIHPKDGPYSVIGASGGTYGCLGMIVGHMVHNWNTLDQIIIWTYISTILCTFVLEIVLGFVLASNTSYATHVGGFLGGVMISLSASKVMDLAKPIEHSFMMKCCFIILTAAYTIASVINLLML